MHSQKFQNAVSKINSELHFLQHKKAITARAAMPQSLYLFYFQCMQVIALSFYLGSLLGSCFLCETIDTLCTRK